VSLSLISKFNASIAHAEQTQQGSTVVGVKKTCNCTEGVNIDGIKKCGPIV